MSNLEFSPRQTIKVIFSRWYIMVILMVLGGLSGLLFHYLQPPIYEATASITINLYFDKRELTQYEADTALNAAGAIISSTRLSDTFLTELQNRGFSPQDASRIQKNSSMDAMQSVWDLHVRDNDPEAAAEYANLWASIAEQTLNDALVHALLAEQLQNQINSIQSCLPPLPPIPDPPIVVEACHSYSLSEINTALQSWATEMAEEQRLSQGILSITTISLNHSATVPAEPVLYGQANLVLAGACIGFFLSLWVTNIPNVRLHRRTH
jgi:capsular polysaccharide biosynthesis protein